MTVTTKKSYCRFCHAYCAIEVDVEDNQVLAVRGDPSDPVYGGYTCIKGRQMPELHKHPTTLRKSLKRQADGSFAEIGIEQALDEIADRLQGIQGEFGPRAVASYMGSYAFQNSAALLVSKAWHQAMGSTSYYTSITIDQPAKFIAGSRFGMWAGGGHGFSDANVAMIIGNNTVVSQYSPFGGVPAFSPYAKLRDAQSNGLKVICIDPRETEVAKRADMYLQIRPGEDPTLLAAMIKVIIEEQLFDAEFVDNYVSNLAPLSAAVADFDLAYAAKRTGLKPHQIADAARLFAQGPKGVATTGTGPDMSPRANLTEHLVLCLNSLCGRVYRAGEVLPNPGVLAPKSRRKGAVIPPMPAFGHGPKSRVRGLGEIFGEMPTAALNDEILQPGDGQIKALLCIGGNPVVAFPDQDKTEAAMQALDLLVCIDVRESATSQFADYIIAPKLSLEREDVTMLTDTWYEQPYSHYSEAIIEADPECIDEWEFYWELGRRLGLSLELPGGTLSNNEKPSKFEVLEKLTPNSRIPLAEIRKQPAGHIFEQVEVVIDEVPVADSAKFEFTPDGVVDELTELRQESLDASGQKLLPQGYSFLLISRRLKHVFNSSGQQLSALAAKGTTNPAYMNPEDMQRLGLQDQQLVRIESEAGVITGVVQASNDLKLGVVSMAHAWGSSAAKTTDPRKGGASTNRLVADDKHFDPLSGMPRSSSIPIKIQAA